MRIELTTFPIYDPDATSELQLSKTELLMRIELTTSSLPRKCSTPELQQLERSQTYLFQISSLNIAMRIELTTFPITTGMLYP
jgi:hypothetical protein